MSCRNILGPLRFSVLQATKAGQESGNIVVPMHCSRNPSCLPTIIEQDYGVLVTINRLTWVSLIVGLDSSLEHGTGFSTGTWDWNLGLERETTIKCLVQGTEARITYSLSYYCLYSLLKHLSSSSYRSKVTYIFNELLDMTIDNGILTYDGLHVGMKQLRFEHPTE